MTSVDPTHPPAIGRRRFLIAAGAALVAACSPDPIDEPATGTASDKSTPSGDAGEAEEPEEAQEPEGADGAEGADRDSTPLTEADFDPLPTCVLLPEAAAGPFPLDEQFDRFDITEGYPGHPLRLGFRVVDGACQPVAGAAVEVWHADAGGDYSAFEDGGDGKDEGPGTTFLRGTRTAGNDGIVEFQTIYPGWYPGRAVHIHLRVHVEAETVLTTQVYFDDDYTATVHREEPYAEHGPPGLSTADDGLAGDPAGEGTLLATGPAATVAGPGSLSLANLGVST